MKPLALFVLLVLGAEAAHADVPSPGNSSEPAGLSLVGYSGTTADPLGAATFVIRHYSGTPMNGASVTLDFGACTDMRLSADAPDPGLILLCSNHLVRALTDRNGEVTFHIVGAGNGPRLVLCPRASRCTPTA
jgi:hypothetical protein